MPRFKVTVTSTTEFYVMAASENDARNFAENSLDECMELEEPTITIEEEV